MERVLKSINFIFKIPACTLLPQFILLRKVFLNFYLDQNCLETLKPGIVNGFTIMLVQCFISDFRYGFIIMLLSFAICWTNDVTACLVKMYLELQNPAVLSSGPMTLRS